jgi:hypothetical protein
VAGCVVPLADTVKLLGVTIDRRLSFDEHVQNVCKSAYYHILALKHIRSSLSTDMAKTVASALVILDSITPTPCCTTLVQGICRNYSEFRTRSSASLHTQNVLSIFTLYFNNYTGFQSITISTTRWRHWRIKCGQLEVQHTYFHQSATMLQPEIHDHPHNICSTCPSSGRR